MDLEAETDRLPAQERIRFKSAASLGFPASDVLQVSQDQVGRHQLEVAFLGLHGSQSPMPGYYLDDLAWEYAQGEPKLGLFLDFFHHRLLTLLHRGWRKYRYHVRFQDNGSDGFSRLMFALVGLGNQAVRDSLPVNRAKMLSYAGMLASPSRSPEVVAGLVSHCFDLEDVVLEAWQARKVAVHPEQQNRLGRANVRLGGELVLGDKVNDCAGKFVLRINALSFERFLSFLPMANIFSRWCVLSRSFYVTSWRGICVWDLAKSKRAVYGSVMNKVVGSAGAVFRATPVDPYVTICVQE